MNSKDRTFFIEDPCNPESIRFNVPSLLKCLTTKKDGELQVSPSSWRRELSKTNAERHDQISKTLRSSVLPPEWRPPDEVLVRPPVLVFQNWNQQVMYKQSFSIMNKSKHVLELGCKPPRCECFQVNTDFLTLRHLSPRQVVVVTVTFTPSSEEDQLGLIKFTLKKREDTFVIPVLAIGPRYIVSCNDCVFFDEALINMEASINFHLTNVNSTQLDLILLADPPFSINPNKIVLEPHTSTIAKVSITAEKTGKHEEKLRIIHRTGEELFVDLIGIVIVGDITLSGNHVDFPGVYVKTTASDTVTLQSNVQYPVQFSWRRYQSEEQEKTEVDRVHESLRAYEYQRDKPDILSQNLMEKENKFIDLGCFLFQNPFFEIHPLTGSISPMAQFTCSIFYKPTAIAQNLTKAFLHTECRVERAELSLEGRGIGPRIDPNITLVDLGVCKYLTKRGVEVKFANYGQIHGTLKYHDDYGRLVLCEPEILEIAPQEVKLAVFLIYFKQKGPFLMDLKFTILESDEIITISVKGSSVGMPLSITPTVVDFGIVALGFVQSSTFEFTNDGDEPFEYMLIVETDGHQVPIKITEFQNHIRSKFPPAPREFVIIPRTGVINGNSRIYVEVEFTPNKIHYSKPVEISIYVNGFKVEDLCVELKYYCHHPMVSCSPFEFDLPYMVLNEPTSIDFELVNDSPAPVAYIVSLIGNHLQSQFSKRVGILSPGTHVAINALLTPLKLGNGQANIGVDLFGRFIIEEVCWINYVCSAPRLNIDKTKLEWHVTQDNKDSDLTKQIVISNPFHHAMHYALNVEDYPHIWQISPMSSNVDIDQIVTVKPLLVDHGTTTFNLTVTFPNDRDGVKLIVHSSVSTAIRSVPDIWAGYDFGNVLKGHPVSETFKIVNLGTKHDNILTKPREMNMYTYSKGNQVEKIVSNSYFAHLLNVSGDAVNRNPFVFNPRSFKLKPSEEVEVTLDFKDQGCGQYQTTFDIYIMDNYKRCDLGSTVLTANVIESHLALTCGPPSQTVSITDKKCRVAEGIVEIQTAVKCIDKIECKTTHPYFVFVDDDGERQKAASLTLSGTLEKAVSVVFDPFSCPSRVGSFQTKFVVSAPDFQIKKSVEITGEIFLPHFTWTRDQTVDFGCLYPFQDGHELITLKNDCLEPLSFSCRYLAIFISRKPTEEIEEYTSCSETNTEDEEVVEEDEERSKEMRFRKSQSMSVKSKMKTKKKSGKKSAAVQKPIEPVVRKPSEEKVPPEVCVKAAQKEIAGTVIPVVGEFVEKALTIPGLPSLSKEPIPLDQFNEYFVITPMSGLVLPNESVTMSVAYHPKEPNVRVDALVEVYKDDDYSEIMTLTGLCRENFQYEISHLTVDFGIIPFCEESFFDVTVRNLTECPMELEVLNLKTEDTSDISYQRLATICVSPARTTVDPFASCVLQVSVVPHVLTKFLKNYQIKIHGTQSETLTVKGTSSLHFLQLPQSFPVDSVPIADQYNGLRIMFNRLHPHPEVTSIPRSSSEVCLTSPGDDFDWEIISTAEEILEMIDFYGAMTLGLAERASKLYCRDFAKHSTYKEEFDPIPHVVLPLFEFDMGCSLINEENTKYLNVINRSELDSYYTLEINKRPTSLSSMGLKIDGLYEMHFISRGKTARHKLTFLPNKNRYKLKKKPFCIKMGWLLTLKVACGPVLKIHLFTHVSQPSVDIPTVFDFGSVRCNERVVMKIKMKNENVADCEWNVEMRRSFHEQRSPHDMLRDGGFSPIIPNPFALEGPETTGLLGPMSEMDLLVSFEPRSNRKIFGELRVGVDNDRFSQFCELRGQGLCPDIEFTPAEVNFEGIVPHSGFTQKNLTIRNKSPFPVLLYFPECLEYSLEQFMLRSVLDYLGKNELYVPAFSEDDTISNYVYDLFRLLLEEAYAYFAQRNIVPTLTDDPRLLVTEFLRIANSEEEETTPRMDLLTKAYKRWISAEQERILSSKLGSLIICSGAPTIDYILEANQMASAMDYFVASFDQLFFEELVHQETAVAADIRQMIDRAYHKYMLDSLPIPQELLENKQYQPLIWQMKVQAINLYSKNIPPKSTGNASDVHADTKNTDTNKGKKEISKTKSKPGKLDRVSSANLIFFVPIFLTTELLRKKVRNLMSEKGLVIDRLASDIYKDPLTVLQVFLSITNNRDRKDLVDMFDTLDDAMARFDQNQETEIEGLESLKPRFSQICLFSNERFGKLDSTEMDAFFEELERRYVLCHGGEPKAPGGKRGRRSTKKRTKSAQAKKRKSNTGSKQRAQSYTKSKKSTSSKSRSSKSTPSKPSMSNRKSRLETKFVINNREIYKMKMEAEFSTYEAQRKDVRLYLENKKMKNLATRSVSQYSTEQAQELYIWVMNTNSSEPQKRIHEMMGVFQGLLPPKTRNVVAIKQYRDRFFRLDRPPFINEIDGEEDGWWFPSITDTLGLYSADKNPPFSVYPILPSAVYCGISRQNQRNSLRLLDEEQIFQFYLEPNEKVSLLTVFHPKEAGIFGKTLRLNVAEWPGLGEQLEITGISDIPHVDVDLRTLFPPHCYAEEEVPDIPNLGVVQRTILEMGPTLISKDKQFQAKSYLNFKNISHVPCKIGFSVYGDDSLFKLEKNEATLKPNDAFLLNITAQPTRQGFAMCDIVASIEDNPMPIMIEARVEGIRINVLAEPRSIKIENVLITRKGEALMKLTNKTLFPVEWKLGRDIRNHPYLLLPKRSGALSSEETIFLKIGYIPTIAQWLDVALHIMVRPKMGSGAKYTLGPSVKLSLSSRDLALDLKSFIGEDRHLVFPEAYINTEQKQSFVVTNLSHFPLKFEVKHNPQLTSDFKREFRFSPFRGTIQKGRNETVTSFRGCFGPFVSINYCKIVSPMSKRPKEFFEEMFTSVSNKTNRSLTLKSSPVLLVEIWDVAENVMVAELPVLVTCKIVYPSYSIKPLEDVSFGSIAVEESSSLIFAIENNGNLPLTYDVLTEDQNKVVTFSDLLEDHDPKKKQNRKRDRKKHADHPSFFIQEKDKLLRLKDKGHFEDIDRQKKERIEQKGKNRKHGKTNRGKKPISEPAKRAKSKSISRTTTVKSAIPTILRVVNRRLTRKNRSTLLRWSLKKPLKKAQSDGRLAEKREDRSTKEVPFLWQNSAGVVLPKQTADVVLSFNPEEKGEWKKRFFFKIEKSQSGPQEINIHGSGVLPSINHSLKDVLRDALIDQAPEVVQSAVVKGYPCNTYDEESHTLQCYNYIVGQKTPFKIYLVNDGIVNATVRFYFTCEAPVNCFSFPNDQTDIFVTISPKTTKPSVIFFTPNSTESIESTLHIDLQLPKKAEQFHCIIKMQGTGNIPQIEITKPDEYDPQENKFTLNIGEAFIGYPITDYFTFKNVGNVVAKVMLEFEKSKSIFTFHARGEYTGILKQPSNNPLIEPVCITVRPDQDIDINVEYNAESKILDACTVYLHVIGNPYDSHVLYIYGKGTQKELVLSMPMKYKEPERKINTETVRRRKALTTATQQGLAVVPHSTDSLRSYKLFYYELEFPSMLTNQFVKKTFNVSNATYFTFRLVFPKPNMVWFVPSVCHIGAHSELEIVTVFHAEEEIAYSEMITALFESVAHSKVLDSTNWLNATNLHQKLLAMPDYDLQIKESDLMEIESQEPGYEVLSGKSVDSRMLTLLVTARAGVPHIKIKTEYIKFPLTRSCEETTATLFVGNEGFVPATCMIRLDSLVKEDRSEMGLTLCSMGLLTDCHFLTDDEPLIESRQISKIEKKSGYIYAPKPIPKAVAVAKSSQDGSNSKMSSNEKTLGRLYNPFSVSSEILTIAPGETQYVKVAFRPMENCFYKCQLIAWDILEKIEKISELEGETAFSPCHILCEPGQFINLERPDTKVIDIRASALGTTAKKKFALMNIHSVPFNFHLTKDDKDEKEISCQPLQGFVAIDCQEEITVVYEPSSENGVQSYWTLSIPAVNIFQNILINGKVISPDVRLVPPALTVPASLTGMFHSVDLAVVNNDDFEYEFTLHQLPMVLGSIDCGIVPKKGTLRPKKSTPVNVAFSSLSSGNTQIEIACDLKGYNTRSVAIIFAEFIELKCKFSWHLKDGEKKKLEPEIVNDINLGYIEYKKAYSVNFTLANYGQGPFRYRWVEDEFQEKHGFEMDFEKLEGCVRRQATETLRVIFIPEINVEFRNHIVKLQVYRGPSYILKFSGHSELLYRFSFERFDFGKCPILELGICDYITTLYFSNESDQEIVLECRYPSKPQLRVLWTGGEVHPRETVPIMVEFYPSEQIQYVENVYFTINGSIHEMIEFTGKGIIIAVRIEDSMNDTVDMTKVPLDSKQKKSRKIINYSHLPVNCRLEVDNWPDLKLEPMSFTMKEGRSQVISIEYSPKSKSQVFTADVFVNAGVMKDFLFRVKCSSSHVSVRLDKKMLLFGRAVKYCSVKMSVNLINDGDIGVNYYWDLDKLNSLLTVTPEQGFLAQHSTLQVNLSLLSLRKMNINHKIKLVYNDHQEEELKILGEFTEIPDPSETINFKTPVRTSVSYTVNLENKTGETQMIFPVLIGEYYSCPDFLEILPHARSPYTVTYSPQTMTADTGHSGRLFVPFPNGTCVYYALVGESLPPDPKEILNWTVTTKTQTTFEFPVDNWMNSFQRLMANVSLDKAQTLPQGMVSIMGEPTVCIGSRTSITYPVEVTVCKQMTFSFRMFFTNPDTKEYLYFVVNVESLPPPKPELITMDAAVGTGTTARINLSNPFSEPVEFVFKSPVPELTAANVTAPPYAQVEMIVTYAPDVVEDPKTVDCQVFGEPFDEETHSFYLQPMPSINVDFPPKYVDAYLGNSVDFNITVRNPSKLKAFYNVVVVDDELTVHDNDFEIQSNKTYSLAVTYEPQEIKSKHFTIELQSTLGDTLRYLVFATCHAPKPMGPMIVEVDSFESILFKNVFSEKATFMLYFNDEFFEVSIANEESVLPLPGKFELESKEMAFLGLELRLQDTQDKLIENFPIAEKLVIELIQRGDKMLQDQEIIKWTWYVKGLPPKTKLENDNSVT